MAKVKFWLSSARMIGNWQICDVDENLVSINETSRPATVDDYVRYLGHVRTEASAKDMLEGILIVKPAEIILMRGNYENNQGAVIVKTNVQLNITDFGFSALASFTGDIAYGLMAVEGFIIEVPE